MNLKNKKIIIVSPHPDDETLGAGGFIKKLIEQNNTVKVLTVSGHLPPLYSREDYEVTVEEAKKKWQLHTVEVIHRLGKLSVKDCSIAIAVSTSHRGDAYEASRYIIDTIKHAVPIWKKEFFENNEVWVTPHP